MIKLKKTTIYIFLIFIGIVLYIIINNNNIEKYTLYNCGCDEGDKGCGIAEWMNDSEVLMDHMPGVRHYLFEGVPEYIINQAQNILSNPDSSWQEVGAYSQENLTKTPRRQIWITQYRDINAPVPEAERRLGQYPFLFDDNIKKILEEKTIVNNEIKSLNQIGYSEGPYAAQLSLLEDKDLILAEAQRRINLNYRNGGINAARQTRLDQMFINIYPPPDSNFIFHNNNDIGYENLWDFKTENLWSPRHCRNNPVFKDLLPSELSEAEIERLHNSFIQNASSLSVSGTELRNDLAGKDVTDLQTLARSFGAEAARYLPFDHDGLRAEAAQRERAVDHLGDMPPEAASNSAFDLIFSYKQKIRNAINASENVGTSCSSDDHCHFNNECVNSQCKTRIGESTTIQTDDGASVAGRQYAMCGVGLNDVCLDNPQLGFGYINYHNNHSNDSNFYRYSASCSKFTNRFQCLGGNNLMRGGIPSDPARGDFSNLKNYSLNPNVLGNTCALKCINASHSILHCDENNVQDFNWKPDGDLDPDEPCICKPGYISRQNFLFSDVNPIILDQAQERLDLIRSGTNICTNWSWNPTPPESLSCSYQSEVVDYCPGPKEYGEYGMKCPESGVCPLYAPEWTLEEQKSLAEGYESSASAARHAQSTEDILQNGLCFLPGSMPSLHNLKDKYNANFILRHFVDKSILDIADEILKYNPTKKLKDMTYPYCNKHLYVHENISEVGVDTNGNILEEKIICKKGYYSTINTSGELVKCNTDNRKNENNDNDCLNDIYGYNDCRDIDTKFKEKIEKTPLTLYHIFSDDGNKIIEYNYFLVRKYSKYDTLTNKFENYEHKAIYKISDIKDIAIDYYYDRTINVVNIAKKDQSALNEIFKSIYNDMINKNYTVINNKLIYFIMFLIKCYDVIIETETSNIAGSFFLNTSSTFDEFIQNGDPPSIYDEFNQYYENDIYDYILLEQLGLNPAKDYIIEKDNKETINNNNSLIRLDFATIISQHPDIFFLATPKIQELLSELSPETPITLDNIEILKKMTYYIFNKANIHLVDLFEKTSISDKAKIHPRVRSLQERIARRVKTMDMSRQESLEFLRKKYNELDKTLRELEKKSIDYEKSIEILQNYNNVETAKEFAELFNRVRNQFLIQSEEGERLDELKFEGEISNFKGIIEDLEVEMKTNSVNTREVSVLEDFQRSYVDFLNDHSNGFSVEVLKDEWDSYCRENLNTKYSMPYGDLREVERSYFTSKFDDNVIESFAEKMRDNYIAKVYLWLDGESDEGSLKAMKKSGILTSNQIQNIRELAKNTPLKASGLADLDVLGVVNKRSLLENVMKSMSTSNFVDDLRKGIHTDYFCYGAKMTGDGNVVMIPYNMTDTGKQLEFLHSTIKQPELQPEIPRLMMPLGDGSHSPVFDMGEYGETPGEVEILAESRDQIRVIRDRLKKEKDPGRISKLEAELQEKLQELPLKIDDVRPLTSTHPRPSLPFAELAQGEQGYDMTARSFISSKAIQDRFQVICAEQVKKQVKAKSAENPDFISFTKLFKEMQQLHFTGEFTGSARATREAPCQVSLTVPKDYQGLLRDDHPTDLVGKFRFTTNKHAISGQEYDDMQKIFKIRNKVLSKIEIQLLKKKYEADGGDLDQWRLTEVSPEDRVLVRNMMASISDDDLIKLIGKGGIKPQDLDFMNDVKSALFINPYASQCYYLEQDLQDLAVSMVDAEIGSMKQRMAVLQQSQEPSGKLGELRDWFYEKLGKEDTYIERQIDEYRLLTDQLTGKGGGGRRNPRRQGRVAEPAQAKRVEAIERYKELLEEQQVTEYREAMKRTVLETTDKFKSQISFFPQQSAVGEAVTDLGPLREATTEALIEGIRLKELDEEITLGTLDLDAQLRIKETRVLGLNEELAKAAEDRLNRALRFTGERTGPLDQVWQAIGGTNSNWRLREISELNVHDLKGELKARNLPTGGRKEQLVQRLRLNIEESREPIKIWEAIPGRVDKAFDDLRGLGELWGASTRQEYVQEIFSGDPTLNIRKLEEQLDAANQEQSNFNKEFEEELKKELGEDRELSIREMQEKRKSLIKDAESEIQEIREHIAKKKTEEKLQQIIDSKTNFMNSIDQYNLQVKNYLREDYLREGKTIEQAHGMVSEARAQIITAHTELLEKVYSAKDDPDMFRIYLEQIKLDNLLDNQRSDMIAAEEAAQVRGQRGPLTTLLDESLIRDIEDISKEFRTKYLNADRIHGVIANCEVRMINGRVLIVADTGQNSVTCADLEMDFNMERFAELDTEIEELTVIDALEKMKLGNNSALMFRNKKHSGLNMIYKREDGLIGWVDPRGNRNLAKV